MEITSFRLKRVLDWTYSVPWSARGEGRARDTQADDISPFSMDGDQRIVTCPQGKTSRTWTVRQEVDSPHVSHAMRAQFGKQDGLVGPARSQWTTAVSHPRHVSFRPQAHQEAMHMARSRQQTPECKERSAKRAGVEGTIAQGVRVFDLRRSRSIGQAKTHMPQVITATAMQVTRLFAWLMGDSPGETRISRFAALAISAIRQQSQDSAVAAGIALGRGAA